jgi:hypothetical protein
MILGLRCVVYLNICSTGTFFRVPHSTQRRAIRNGRMFWIHRGLQLRNKIQVFSTNFRDELDEDFLIPEDWDVLRQLKMHLHPFKRLIKQPEGHAVEGYHGAILEALPAIEHLLKHLENLKTSITDICILECVNNSWTKLNNYYGLTDNNRAVYAAATLLHPVMRITRFQKS